MSYEFDWSVLFREPYRSQLVDGLLTTLRLAGLGLLFALILGIPIGIARMQRGGVVGRAAFRYVDFVRTTPPLIHILFWFFGASVIFPEGVLRWLVDHNLKFGTTVIALSIYTSAFIAEIVRAGIQAINKGQFEAGYSLGLSGFQTGVFIIAPQVTRITMPPLINEFISLLKNTALGVAIGVTELTYQAKLINDYTFRVIESFTAATIIYLLLSLLLASISNVLTRKIQLEH